MNWVAYCVDCKKDVYESIPNGAFVDAGARRHIKENPNHRVIVGYNVVIEEDRSYRMICSNRAFDGLIKGGDEQTIG